MRKVRKVKKKNIIEKLKESIQEKKEKKLKEKERRSGSRVNKQEKNSKPKIKKEEQKSKGNITIKNKKQEKVKKEKKKRSLWKKILTIVLIIGIIGVLSIAAFFAYVVITSPKFSESAFAVNDQTIVYDINGNIIAKLGAQKRESVTYDELPQVLIDAIVATEDSRFFQHNGVDLPRFIKATALNLIGQDDAGGASTITMQAVKNNLTQKGELEKSKIKKIIRKFQDVYLAVFKVEKEYSKEEIIELYVNNYNLGSNVYGVGEASKYYFGKSVSELTLPEASMIAGLFQAPGRHNPYKNIESATKRRNTVLYLMQYHGYITEEEAELAKKVSIESLLVGVKGETEYQGYIDTVVEEVQKKTGDNPYSVPMKIYTTMEKGIQDGINKVMTSDAWYWRDNQVQAGVAVVNVETGAIAAVGTGRNKTGKLQFNFATQAYRQPGSTAKPIFAYGPGIEYNNFSTYTLFNDEPWTYTNGPSINNWDGKFLGLITTRYALQVSRNIPAVKAFQQIGTKNVQKFAYSLGLDVSLNSSSENYRIVNKNTGVDNTVNEAYAIGGVAEGFTPLAMASAYSAFASGGYYTEPHCVTKIEYRKTGEVKEYKTTKTRVMKDSTAYLINNILESAVNYGFNGGANVAGSHVAAKTGTSNFDEATMKSKNLPYNAVNDLWTVAYTSKYSVAVWYGYKEVTSTTYNINGTGHKEGVTRAVMQYIPKDTKGWSTPSSVVCLNVEKETSPAKLPSEYTPSNMVTNECFVKGTQPTEISNRYGKLNDVTNLEVKKNTNTSATISWQYTNPDVITEEYLKNYFNQSVYGNEKEKYYNARIEYNKKTLGDIGFGIYKVENDGTTTLIAFTKELTYTYTGYGNTELIVKAEYEKFKSNASTGTKATIKFEEIKPSKLIATLAGKGNTITKIGTYTEEGLKAIYYGTLNVTETATVKYQITVNNELREYNDKVTLQTYINTLPANTYKITYIINYLDQEETKTRNLTLKES